MHSNNNNNNTERERERERERGREGGREGERERERESLVPLIEDVTEAVGKPMYTPPRLLKSLSNVAREQVRNLLISLPFSVFHLKNNALLFHCSVKNSRCTSVQCTPSPLPTPPTLSFWNGAATRAMQLCRPINNCTSEHLLKNS